MSDENPVLYLGGLVTQGWRSPNTVIFCVLSETLIWVFDRDPVGNLPGLGRFIRPKLTSVQFESAIETKLVNTSKRSLSVTYF